VPDSGTFGHGQIWWADVASDEIRPVVILTRRRAAGRLTRILVAPITSVDRGIATEVAIGEREGVRDGSVINLDNTQLVHVDRVLRPIGEVSPERWPEVCQAMATAIGCSTSLR
jgi:mRNA-degrading endonuclease toxin of MazEF toxin-antitoxin module